MEDNEMLANENKRMAEVLVQLGLNKKQLDDLCFGGDEALKEAKELVESNIVAKVKEKLSRMDSDQIFDFTYGDEGVE